MIKLRTESGSSFTVDYYHLPGGEIQLVFGLLQDWLGDEKRVHVLARLHDTNDIFSLVFLSELLSRRGVSWTLTLPYVPYGRQDRAPDNLEESFTLKAFAQIINGLTHETVTIFDPHSDVTPALLDRVRVIPQDRLFTAPVTPGTVFISPDGGSLKKIYKVAKGERVVCAQKHRDEATGKLSGVSIDMPQVERAIIVDDICDGGATFVKLGKLIRPKVNELSLYVTHGIFSQGLTELEDIFDKIYIVDSYYAGNEYEVVLGSISPKLVILNHVARYFFNGENQ